MWFKMLKFSRIIIIITLNLFQVHMSSNLEKFKRSDKQSNNKSSKNELSIDSDNMRNFPDAGLILQDKRKTGGMLIIEGLDSFMFIPKKHDCEKDHDNRPTITTIKQEPIQPPSTITPSTTSYKPYYSANPAFITNRPNRPIRPMRPLRPRPASFTTERTINVDSLNESELIDNCKITNFLAFLGIVSMDPSQGELCQLNQTMIRDRRKSRRKSDNKEFNNKCWNNKFCNEKKKLPTSVPLEIKKFFSSSLTTFPLKKRNIEEKMKHLSSSAINNEVNENILRKIYQKYVRE